MRFRRPGQGDPNRTYPIRTYTAANYSSALFILRDVVDLKSHPYLRDPNSGAGNCWCGADQSHKIHNVEIC